VARKHRNERGAAVVEMAFMTIFLLILVTGIIDIGRAIYTNISIQEAAQEGAYYGSFEETVSEIQIAQRVADSTSSPTIDPVNDVIVDCVTATKSKKNGTRVTVTVDYELDLVTPLVGQWLGGSLDLQKVAEAERFYETCPS
jgi:Flp pilus assembly protein TadG